jgi:hypothetical protein
MAWVIVPALMKLVRSCGILAVPGVATVWLGKEINFSGFEPVTNGVMRTGFMVGGPTKDTEVPWAPMVVPCGIDAMRMSVTPSAGTVVGGTIIHSPGSTWIPGVSQWVVISVIVCR